VETVLASPRNYYLLNPCKGVAISHLDAFILTPTRLRHIPYFSNKVVYCGWAYFIPAQGIITVFSYKVRRWEAVMTCLYLRSLIL
jgi:hypothetical protein